MALQLGNDVQEISIDWKASDDCSKFFLLGEHKGMSFKVVFIDIPPNSMIGIRRLGEDLHLSYKKLGLKFNFSNLLCASREQLGFSRRCSC
ncbi:hypothetical protein TNCV_663271 [Trichonephila clavipes]|nr:hypothetical protein TNCV_663271 [Trichonephila clavipes]